MIDGKFCVRKAFENVMREANESGTYKRQSAYRKENCIMVKGFSEKGARGSREVLDRQCVVDKQKQQQVQRQCASSSCNCEFCQRKRRELEYQKTVRLLNLMRRAR